MNIGFLILFCMMLLPAFLAMAFASRNGLALFWNFCWFLIYAQVGLKAFGSVWGAFPALIFALNYAMRAMRKQTRPKLNIQLWNFMTRSRSPAEQSSQSHLNEEEVSMPRKARPANDVIDAEFRREPN